MRRRLFVRVFIFLAILFVLGRTAGARAEEDASGDMLPRDVSVVVQPSATRLSAVPSDFRRIDAGWLVIEFPSSVRERVAPLVREAQDARARLSDDLGQAVLEHELVRIARTPDQMAELAPEGAPPPTYAAGVAYPSIHFALLSLKAPDTWEATDLSELLRHELTHLALAEAVSGHHTPRWFDEGLAIHESGELWLTRTRTLWEATLSKRLLPLSDLDRGFPDDRGEVSVAYAESADFVRFLMRDMDRARFGSLVERVRSGVAFDRALEDAYGADARKLEYEWREELGQRFGMAPVLTGGGLLWVVMVGLVVVAWVKRRRHAKAKLAQWAREEAEVDAAIAAGAARAADAPAPAAEGPMPASVPAPPLVEHDGRWYTLH